MSFICDICGLPTENNQLQNKEVVLTREKSYHTIFLKKLVNYRKQKYKRKFLHGEDINNDLLYKLKKENWIIISDRKTKGTEIIKENKLCLGCANITKGK